MESKAGGIRRKKAEAKVRGGQARSRSLSSKRRKEIASIAARERWKKCAPQTVLEEAVDDAEVGALAGPLEEARWVGPLDIVGMTVPCYVLGNGQRVIGRVSVTELLTDIKGGGALEKYLQVRPLAPFLNFAEVRAKMVPFRLPEVSGLAKTVKGLPADVLIEVCQAFVAALQATVSPESRSLRLTERQIQMAIKASSFLSACAKVGLDALIDEATGYEIERSHDALQVKLQAYLEEEMRKWEKTFPDDLWAEFGRLTGWKGGLHQRPKYWGKLVNELIYRRIDGDVLRWLKENQPKPRHGHNYHQWLSGQYGLKKLVEQIWTIVGMAKTCKNMRDLRDQVNALDGKVAVSVRAYISPPCSEDSGKKPNLPHE